MQDETIRTFLINAGYQPVYLNRNEFAKVIEDAEKQLEFLVNELGVEFVDD